MSIKNIAKLSFIFLCLPNLSSFACKDECQPSADDKYQIQVGYEYGFNAIVGHEIQFGENNPRFSFIKEGGQNTLFSSWRASLALRFLQDHTLEFLYQPLFLDTQGSSSRETRFDNVTFAAKTPINARYYFPYYRLSYFYHIIDNETFFFSAGAGLQIRNTTISFASADGSRRFATSNIGPVPLITSRLRYRFDNAFWLSADIGGIWAPIPGLNGSDNPVTGWLYDCGVLGGFDLNSNFSWLFSARIIGGGAQGDGAARESGDTYSFNALNVLNFSTGMTYRFNGHF